MPDLPPCRDSLEPAATTLKNLLSNPDIVAAGPGAAAHLSEQAAFGALKQLNTALEQAGLYPAILTPSFFQPGGNLPSFGIEAAANAVHNSLLALKNNPANFTPPGPPSDPHWWWVLTSCNPGMPPNLLASIHIVMDQSGGPPPKQQSFQGMLGELKKLRAIHQKIAGLRELPGVGRAVKPNETAAPASKREQYKKLRIQAAEQQSAVELLKIELGF